MRTRRSPRTGRAPLRLGRVALLAVLAIAPQAGCTREFYREWTNQDVSEAVFEKSRDPRWRLDTFSIECPALSRFADPYDQDVPPAPPDDVATEALSPVPQWPDNRLIVPVEGTGYWELLEYWQRQELAAAGNKDEGLSDPDSTGLPRNLGYGGEPVSLSTDPASRPAIPFRPFPGMANPYKPGDIIDPNEAIDADQPPGGEALPVVPTINAPGTTVPGSGEPYGIGGPAGPRPGILGQPGASSGPAGGVPSLPANPGATRPSPGLPNRLPPRTSPSLPGNGGASTSSSAAANSSRRNLPNDPAIALVRLQDGNDVDPPATFGPRPVPPPRSRANSGTRATRSTHISVSRGASSEARPIIPPPRLPAYPVGAQTLRQPGGKDRMLARVAYQDRPVSGSAVPPFDRATQAPAATATPAQPDQADQPGPPPTLPPALPPSQGVSRPGTLDPGGTRQPAEVMGDQLRDAGKLKSNQATGLGGILVPVVPAMNESEAAGLPKDFKAYKLNMQQSWLLALINGRYYQYQLEDLYLAALPVTLQRFAFEPQFYAGMSPVTGVPETGGAGGSGASINGGSFPTATGLSTANAFTYATRYAPTGQVSTMNLGTIAGFGKLFSSGGQLLMGFASELVFNFAGKNPRQPTVLSSLPFSFVQPLLKGGGRAVILEPLTTEERNLLYQVRAFTQFRQQFFVVTLTGGTVQNFGQTFNLSGFTSAGNVDPVIGFIPAAFNVVQVEIDRRNVAFYQNLVKLYQALIQGEASGLSQLQVDQVQSQLIGARSKLFSDKVTYRAQLDQFKMQLGMPPDIPIVLDQEFLGRPFYDVFNNVDKWQLDPERKLSDLPGIIGRIPQLQDIDIDGRSVLGIYRNYRASRAGENFRPEDEDGLEDVLQAAVRVGLEYRLDLMNFRAQLYDSWRQIRVTANALKGVLNVALTNNVYTGPYTTNPFAFLSQAKNFSLTLQAELPLVRITERNAFRQALINYQRQRRSLMVAEDNVKVQLRTDLRSVQLAYIVYEINKRNYELNVRLKDQSFEQIVAPPAGGTQSTAQSANAATQTINLLNFQSAAFTSQLALIAGFQNYQTQRLIFYRDIGTLPYDEWEAFSELFPTEYHGPIIGHDPARPGLAGSAEAPPPTDVPR